LPLIHPALAGSRNPLRDWALSLSDIDSQAVYRCNGKSVSLNQVSIGFGMCMIFISQVEPTFSANLKKSSTKTDTYKERCTASKAGSQSIE
tara:strand:- start:161 stop:433 length:273 start_codon:yes stop_codon:yes gene_type:complete